jgi:four helix bundle protein
VNFEKLHCWQTCNELKKYFKEKVLTKFPKEEKYDLYSQILRASRLATANIAEGWGRYHYNDNVKFLINARGSVAELLNHSIEAKDCNYISEETLKEIRHQMDKLFNLLMDILDI